MGAPVSRCWLWLSALITILDQLSKHWVTSCFIQGQTSALFSWLNIHLVYNPGAAFNFLAQANGWQCPFLVSLNTVCSIAIFWLLWSKRVNRVVIGAALAFILGGALGNLYDRICYGAVIDFIDFHIGHWHFATFNLADSALCFGAGLWFFETLRGKNS